MAKAAQCSDVPALQPTARLVKSRVLHLLYYTDAQQTVKVPLKDQTEEARPSSWAWLLVALLVVTGDMDAPREFESLWPPWWIASALSLSRTSRLPTSVLQQLDSNRHFRRVEPGGMDSWSSRSLRSDGVASCQTAAWISRTCPAASTWTNKRPVLDRSLCIRGG
jgi:hypothetical protein